MKKISQRKPKVLLLFSGGLDSILAAKILAEQRIEVTALTFVSYFFDAEQAKESAKKNKIKLIVEDISEKHLKIVKNPCHGRGAGMNPCIDCHLLMLKIAKKMISIGRYDFVATGEVLGQRPMSQNSKAIKLIEKKAGLAGKILRPLSAKVLPETKIEKDKLVDRKKLLGISGRSRREQLRFLKKYKVKYFPTPAGGCILTDKEFSKKLQDLLENLLPCLRGGAPKGRRGGSCERREIKKSDIDLLRLGRHFWVGKTRVILGRNHEENQKLKKLAEKGDILIDPKNIPGPTALVRGKSGEAIFEYIKKLFLRYIKGLKGNIDLKIISGK